MTSKIPSARSARVAVASYFALMGIVCATWVSSIPDVKDLLGLDDGGLGLLLFSGPVGSMVSFAFISSVIARVGSRRATALGSALYCLVTALLGACFLFRAPFPAWCAALALFGGCGNLLNVAANTQAGLVEKIYGRTIMSSFHAVWSACNLVGVAIAYLAANLNVAPAVRFAVTLAVSVALQLLSARGLVAADASVPPVRGRFHRPDRALLALGAVAIVIMGMEGAIAEWAGVFFRKALRAPEERKLLGLLAAMLAMTAGRSVTDRFVNRFGATAVLRAYCVLCGAGLGFAVSTPFLPGTDLMRQVLSAAGYAIAGFGVSGLIPIVYSRAMRTTSMAPGSAVTFVGSMGFFGYFFGPPVIGALSKATCLSFALGVFCVLVLGCLFVRVGDD